MSCNYTEVLKNGVNGLYSYTSVWIYDLGEIVGVVILVAHDMRT